MAQTATEEAERGGGSPSHWSARADRVELAGQIRELATLTLRNQFRRLDPEEARGPALRRGRRAASPFGPKLSAKAAASLRRMGVEMHMGSRVTDVDQRGLGSSTRTASTPGPRSATSCGRPA